MTFQKVLYEIELCGSHKWYQSPPIPQNFISISTPPHRISSPIPIYTKILPSPFHRSWQRRRSTFNEYALLKIPENKASTLIFCYRKKATESFLAAVGGLVETCNITAKCIFATVGIPLYFPFCGNSGNSSFHSIPSWKPFERPYAPPGAQATALEE